MRVIKVIMFIHIVPFFWALIPVLSSMYINELGKSVNIATLNGYQIYDFTRKDNIIIQSNARNPRTSFEKALCVSCGFPWIALYGPISIPYSVCFVLLSTYYYILHRLQ
jgi:hypothetical protein